ncbi:MAG: hypothetical protein AAGI91_15310 [Bacteroidota bacterium]
MSALPTLHAVRYRFVLRDGAVAGGAPGDPNARVSLPYVPGSALRGVAARSYARSQGDGGFDAADDDPRALLFSGAVRYLHAYPVAEPTSGAATRALPVPRSWVTEKPAPGTPLGKQMAIVDAARSEGIDEGTLYDPVMGPFFVGAGEARAHAPSRDGSIRTQRDRTFRRATRDGGAVFFVDRIARGTVLEAAVVADSTELAARAAALIGTGMRVGRGRAQAAVTLLDDAPMAVTSGEANGFDGWTDDLRAGRHTVTLLSDAVVEGPHGQPEASARAFGAALAEALGVEAVTVMGAFLAPTEVGGSNAHFGLPLERRVALAMGSVLVFETPGVDREAVVRALASGLGEGTEVGLGRFALDFPRGGMPALGQGEAPAFVEPTEAPDLSREDPGDESRVLARRLVDRVVERRLAGPVRALADRWLQDEKKRLVKLTATQLNGLRAAVNEARGGEGAASLRGYLSALSPTQKRHYQELAGWIRDQLDRAEPKNGARPAVFGSLDVSKLDNLRVGTLGPQLDADLALRATLDALALMLTQAPQRRRDP